MSERLFSQDWLNQFVQEIKKGPSKERLTRINENYWTWIEECKQKMDIRLGLVLKENPPQADRYIYLDFEKGALVNAKLGSEEEKGTAHFILSGKETGWQELIEGTRDITQNMMYRKIKLVQGNLHAFFRGIYFFVEMLRAGTRAKTEYSSASPLSETATPQPN